MRLLRRTPDVIVLPEAKTEDAAGALTALQRLGGAPAPKLSQPGFDVVPTGGKHRRSLVSR